MNAERMIENYRKEQRRRRDAELCRKMAEHRTREEMLARLASLRGLNVEERGYARGVPRAV